MDCLVVVGDLFLWPCPYPCSHISPSLSSDNDNFIDTG